MVIILVLLILVILLLYSANLYLVMIKRALQEVKHTRLKIINLFSVDETRMSGIVTPDSD